MHSGFTSQVQGHEDHDGWFYLNLCITQSVALYTDICSCLQHQLTLQHQHLHTLMICQASVLGQTSIYSTLQVVTQADLMRVIYRNPYKTPCTTLPCQSTP